MRAQKWSAIRDTNARASDDPDDLLRDVDGVASSFSTAPVRFRPLLRAQM
jgi:hypothetical protein